MLPPASFWGTLAAIVICTFIWYAWYKKRAVEAFTMQSHYTFLTQEQGRSILQKDADGFVRNMRRVDLKARQSRHPKAYMEKALASVSEFAPGEMDKLATMCRDIDAKVTTRQWKDKWGVNGPDLAGLPWTFMRFEGKQYEAGLPHTRPPDVICIPASLLSKPPRYIKRTLLHEKVHIYQRRYLERVQAALEKAQYVRAHNVDDSSLVRANPDTWSDFHVYRDPAGNLMTVSYRSQTPSSILDTQGSPLQEHPFEVMAIDIAKSVF